MKLGMIIRNYAVINEFSRTGMPTKGGADFHAENQAKQMISLGHQVYIMAKRSKFKLPARETFEEIDVVRIHGPIRWLESIVRLFTTHRDTDVFYIFNNPEFAVWVLLFAQLFRKPSVLVLTQNEPINIKKGWRNKVFCACDRYIAISYSIKNLMIKEMGIPEEKVYVLPQGVDVNRFFRLGNSEKRLQRERNKIPIGCPVVLFCARVAIAKGVDTLQKAWTIVHAKNKDAILLVVGGGDEHLIEDIVNTSQNLDGSIRVLGEVKDPAPWYQIADIYFFPSRSEGLPTSLMEAMASGLPSVTSKVSGCEDLVIDNKTGYLVDCEDATTMADRILELIDNVCKREELGEQARQYAVKDLDCNKLKYRLESILSVPKK